jgi:hypothetical protein
VVGEEPGSEDILTSLLAPTTDGIMRVRGEEKKTRQHEIWGPTSPLTQGLVPSCSGLGHYQDSLQDVLRMGTKQGPSLN